MRSAFLLLVLAVVTAAGCGGDEGAESCDTGACPSCAEVAGPADIGNEGFEPECEVGDDCDDSNPCTVDSCTDGQCVNEIQEGAVCDDGDECTAGDACGPDGQCQPGDALVCDDEDQCTNDTCDPSSGCVFTIDALPCDDGNACTTGDGCVDGECVAGAVTDCDDDNPCTIDACNPAGGECEHTNQDEINCDDGDACTIGDQCELGVCMAGPALDCDDANPCTDDNCDSAEGCVSDTNTLPCDDGSLCTTADTCADGNCVGTVTLDCDDGEVCTADSCLPESGCQHVPAAAPCDDGDACTEGDECSEGTCAPGAEKSCDDENECTLDACDPETGECLYSDVEGGCDDGNMCTTGDTCVAGLCVSEPLACDDGEVCTSDSCDVAVGCVATPVAGSCDDGNMCTLGDSCEEGECIAGADQVSCDDDNPCTDDGCDQETGECQNVANQAFCDDGNECTEGDQCSQGACVPGAENLCQCESDADCDEHDDEDLCNGVLVCDLESFPSVCIIDAASVVECDSAEDSTCSKNLCDPKTAECAMTPVDEGEPCDDESMCTEGDACVEGECLGDFIKCDDDNPCSDDSCSAETGCVFVANDLACDDGNPCTLLDHCVSADCVGQQFVACDDGNPCTDDACVPDTGGCVFNTNTIPCNDGTSCTTNDTCLDGVCSGSPVVCDDLNLCTEDSCDPDTGCVFAANALPCDDSNPCTTPDVCSEGVCSPMGQLDCDDGNACTDDQCVPQQGSCVQVANTSACDDGNACTADDTCASMFCLGLPVNCSDGNVCTDDACAPDVGCYYLDNEGPCDDLNLCSLNDHCEDGFCVAGPFPECDDANICTADTCIPETGECQYLPTESDCDDGSLCTTGDQCAEGLCGGVPAECDDGNVCTADSCDAESGCKYEPAAAPCDDLDQCTEEDFCEAGECLGQPVDCDDSNVCTNDSCDSVEGCQYENNLEACDDLDPATTLDVCDAGSCAGLPDPDEDQVPSTGFDHTCGDGELADCNDNCPDDPNPGQADWNDNGVGDTCDVCQEQELCNGKDDDCDDEIDEGFEAVGEACDGPDVDLCKMGVWACAEDGSALACQEEDGTVPFDIVLQNPASPDFVTGTLAAVSFPLSGATSLNTAALITLFDAATVGSEYAAFEIPDEMFVFSLGKYLQREEPGLRFFVAVDLDASTLEIIFQGNYQNMGRFFGPARGVHTYGDDPGYDRQAPMFVAKHVMTWLTVNSYLNFEATVDLTSPTYRGYHSAAAPARLFLLSHETRQCCGSDSDGSHNSGDQEFIISADGLQSGFHFGRTVTDMWNHAWIYRESAIEAHAQDCCAGDVMSKPEPTTPFTMKLSVERTFDDAWAAWFFTGIAIDMSSNKGLDEFNDYTLERQVVYAVKSLTPPSLDNPSPDPSLHEEDAKAEGDASSCNVKQSYSAPVGTAFHKIYFRIWTEPEVGGSTHDFYIEGKDSISGNWERLIDSSSPPATILDKYDFFNETGRVYDQIKVFLSSNCSEMHTNPGHYELKLWSAPYTAGEEVQLVVAGRPDPTTAPGPDGTLFAAIDANSEVEVKVAGETICTGLIHDTDGDDIPDDGDNSGLAGDAPCTGGATAGCDDNCVDDANADQADGDGNGVGDVCE